MNPKGPTRRIAGKYRRFFFFLVFYKILFHLPLVVSCFFAFFFFFSFFAAVLVSQMSAVVWLKSFCSAGSLMISRLMGLWGLKEPAHLRVRRSCPLAEITATSRAEHYSPWRQKENCSRGHTTTQLVWLLSPLSSLLFSLSLLLSSLLFPSCSPAALLSLLSSKSKKPPSGALPNIW